MLIVKTPPIMAACPRGEFTRGPPWRRASLSFFCQQGSRESRVFISSAAFEAPSNRDTPSTTAAFSVSLFPIFSTLSLSLSPFLSVSSSIFSSFIISLLSSLASSLYFFIHRPFIRSFRPDARSFDPRPPCLPHSSPPLTTTLAKLYTSRFDGVATSMSSLQIHEEVH